MEITEGVNQRCFHIQVACVYVRTFNNCPDITRLNAFQEQLKDLVLTETESLKNLKTFNILANAMRENID